MAEEHPRQLHCPAGHHGLAPHPDLQDDRLHHPWGGGHPWSGGTIEQPRDAIAHYLVDMEALADVMAVKKNWDRPQYAIPKAMYLDLKRMHFSLRDNRS